MSPEKKRPRIARACDQCRKKKYRCGGELPTCSTCAAAHRDCSYESFSKKRGLPTGYVRALEVTLGLIFKTSEDVSDTISSILGSDRGISRQKPLSIDADIGQVAEESLLAQWRTSDACKQVDRLLALSDQQSDESIFIQQLQQGVSKFVAATAHIDSLRDTLDERDAQEQSSTLDQRATLPATDISTGAVQSNVHIPHVESFAASCASSKSCTPQEWSQLVEFYLINVHSWFPISSKQEILRSGYLAASEGPTHGNTLTSGDRAYLLAIFAYGAYDRETSHARSESPGSLPRLSTSSAELRRIADGFMPVASQCHDIGHVRALLVLAILEVTQGSWLNAWLSLSRAIYAAVELDILPTKRSQRNGDLVLGDDQRRAALGCFVLDTLIATRLARRPYLDRADAVAIGYIQVNNIEEWEPWQPMTTADMQQSSSIALALEPGRALSTYNEFLYLIGILSDLISSERETKSVSNTVERASQNLQSWICQLPQHCDILHTSTAASQRSTPQSLNLGLAAVAVSLVLITRYGRVIDGTNSLSRTLRLRQTIAHISERIGTCRLLSMPLLCLIQPDTTPELFMSGMPGAYHIEIVSTRNAFFELLERAIPGGQPLAADQENNLVPSSFTLVGQQTPRGRQYHTDMAEDHSLSYNTSEEETGAPLTTPISKGGSFTQPNSCPTYSCCLHQCATTAAMRTIAYDQEAQVEAQDCEPCSENSMYDDFGNSELFNSLLQLDSVDWDPDQTQFMQHLGFPSNYHQQKSATGRAINVLA